MLTRIISGLIGVALWLGVCFWGQIPFVVGVTVLVGLSAIEFCGVYSRGLARQAATGESRSLKKSELVMNTMLALYGLTFPALAYMLRGHLRIFVGEYAVALAVLVLLFGLLAARAAASGQALGGFREQYGLVCMLYAGMLFSSFILMRQLPGRLLVRPFAPADRGAWLMLFVAVCVWATDTLAYFVGRGLGKHKLAPRLSPGKTVEGAIGGLVGALLAGALFGLWIHVPLRHGLAIGLIAGIAGQVGDLFESALKREIGVKDFGRIMPGHGGTLDRFDSLLFVTPLAFLYLKFVVGG